jgi:hypothetical protein
MKKKEGLIAEDFTGIDTITREMVLARAHELAVNHVIPRTTYWNSSLNRPSGTDGRIG